MRSVYLDHSATTPIRAEVLEAMLPFLTQIYGNPSSVHSQGAVAKEALDRAHETVANVLGCRSSEVVFTGSGTESDNLAILGVARSRRDLGNHVITSQIEHDGVLNACRQLEREGFRVTYLPVDELGFVSLEGLGSSMGAETILVSIMLANNEIGTVQPIKEISTIAREYGALVHTDAIQAAGQMNLDVGELDVDLLSISAHKLYGPKGVGALFVRRGTPLSPMAHGGGQERGRRSGTENIAGVVGLAVALALAEDELPSEMPNLRKLRDSLIDGFLSRVQTAHLTGDRFNRLPGHASFYLEGVTGESVLVNLDMAGVACSSGSACSAGSTDPSHVLIATGLPPALAKNGLRMTLGRQNSQEDVDYVLDILPAVIEEIGSGTAATA